MGRRIGFGFDPALSRRGTFLRRSILVKGRSRESGTALPIVRSSAGTTAGFIYRGAGKARRRIRRARLRAFTNVRTATRKRDLPLAIRDPPSSRSPYVPKGGFGPVHFCHNGGLSAAWGPMIPPISYNGM